MNEQETSVITLQVDTDTYHCDFKYQILCAIRLGNFTRILPPQSNNIFKSTFNEALADLENDSFIVSKTENEGKAYQMTMKAYSCLSIAVLILIYICWIFKISDDIASAFKYKY